MHSTFNLHNTTSSLVSFTCRNCNKSYKRVSAYQKHYSICSIIRKKSEKCEYEEEGNNDDVFRHLSSLTKEEMGTILKDVLIKYQIMEKKVDELANCISMKRKKIDVIEWLNVNKRFYVDFGEWVNSIKINREHLDYVFKNSFVKLFSHIVARESSIETEQGQGHDMARVPIHAFTHKDGLLYVYNSDDCSWGCVTEEQLGSLISSVSNQINAEFRLWQDEHKELILSDEKYHDIYLSNINKVLYTNYKTDCELSIKIKRELYNNLKINITI